MKKLILSLVLFLIFIGVYSQSVFQITIGDQAYDENAYSALELSTGEFILTNFKSPTTSILSSPYLIKVSKNGTLIKDIYYQDTTRNFIYVSILEFNSKILLIGVLFNQNGNHTDSIIVTEIDTDLNILSINRKHFTDSLRTANIVVKNLNDSLLLISGYFDKINNNYMYISFVSYLDTNYTIVKNNTNLYEGANVEELNNLIYNKTDSLWYSYIILNSYMAHKIRLNSDLYVDSVFLQKSISLMQPLFIQNIKSQAFILTRLKNNRLKLFKLNSVLDTVSSRFIGTSNTLNYPSVSRGLSSNSHFLFAGITENLNPNNLWWGMQNSNYYVIKMDSLGNTIWDKRIGENGNYYLLYDVLATKDGGCLLSGCVYDYLSGSYQKDIFIVKLDSNGTTIWTKDIKLPAAAISVYPNPCSKELNLNLSEGNKYIVEYSIFDIQAKLLLQKQLNATQTKIDIQNLASGVYIIEVRTNKGKVYRSKFVKK